MRRKKWNVEALLSGALALLGFTGCSDVSDAPNLYGTPSVDYRVLGTVTDEEGKPLEGIQVVMENPYAWYYYDENGKPIESKRNPETGRMILRCRKNNENPSVLIVKHRGVSVESYFRFNCTFLEYSYSPS